MCTNQGKSVCPFHSFSNTWVSARGSLQSACQTVFVAGIFLGPESLYIYIYIYIEDKVPMWLLGWGAWIETKASVPICFVKFKCTHILIKIYHCAQTNQTKRDGGFKLH
jgi:hypothetical protein